MNPTFGILIGRPVRGAMFQIGVSIPEKFKDISKRHWNRIVKEAMTACLETHHKRRIPMHFRQYARSKYGYKPRTAKYRESKKRKYGSTRDLVKTGATERRMKSERQIVIGGAAEGGKKAIEGKLRLKFDFTQTKAFKASQAKRFTRTLVKKFGFRPPRAGVSIEDMKKEIQRFTDQERREFSEQLLREIMKRYRAFQGNRKRRRMPG